MTLAINLSLLVFGLVGALLAFFGETLRKDQTGLSRRVTRLGWFSVACLLLTLALGVWKEVLNARVADELMKDNEKLRADQALAELVTTTAEPIAFQEFVNHHNYKYIFTLQLRFTAEEAQLTNLIANINHVTYHILDGDLKRFLIDERLRNQEKVKKGDDGDDWFTAKYTGNLPMRQVLITVVLNNGRSVPLPSFNMEKNLHKRSPSAP